MDCLRQLIIVLAEQNRIQELCEFEYTGLEREVCGSCDEHVTSHVMDMCCDSGGDCDGAARTQCRCGKVSLL